MMVPFITYSIPIKKLKSQNALKLSLQVQAIHIKITILIGIRTQDYRSEVESINHIRLHLKKGMTLAMEMINL